MKVIRSEHLGILQPQWGVAENGLNFENSLKMKISMMVALLHISFGLGLKMLNEYKRNQLALLAYDSLPKMLLLLTTVGYLNYLVVVKWLTDYSGKEAFAPSVINTIL